MNVTEPPKVEELPAHRVEELSTGLFTLAERTRAQRTRARPVWVPIVAATVGVAAVVSAGTVVLRSAGDSSTPVGDPTSEAAQQTPRIPSVTARYVPPSNKPMTRWTAPPSGTTTLDQGPATEADARRALRRCFTSGLNGLKPADADTAIIDWARWMVNPVTYSPREDFYDTTPRRQLVVSALTADRRVWATCAEDGTGEPGEDLTTGDLKSRSAGNARTPISSGSADGAGTTEDGRWVLSWQGTFTAMPQAARVEIRYTWPQGAGQWHVAYLHNHIGYGEAVAIGSGPKPTNHRVEFRLFDSAGRLLDTVNG